jgi:hypothetical protein
VTEFYERALLAGAKAFLAGETGVIETARALSGLRNDVRPELRDSVRVFTLVDSETDAYPLGEVRKLWNSEALATLDPSTEAAAEFYRADIRAACETIVSVLD